MSRTNKFIQENEDRKNKGLPTLHYNDWSKEHSDIRVSDVIKYLDLDREGPTRGDRNKKVLTKRLLHYISDWDQGLYDDWVCKLSIRLGLAPRTVKENYLNPLITEGIIRCIGAQIIFIGRPEEVSDEEKGTAK